MKFRSGPATVVDELQFLEPLAYEAGKVIVTLTLEPGDLPISTTLFLPTGDREVL
ncbi:hypothetical protein JCM9152_307 [Halalkalibacter hemicellulosilyticusJCM 9152]|uniref:Uncharacterized protein n=1 Tax=Halalkalibacter hemicellulosilyticusJCM 9152 TaxID=1236971 RepID=W4QBD6_9BACI|nr:hypothetical protein JCM9152_307 [Halalkalibacter hemicellulosilyticusJCM 9152]